MAHGLGLPHLTLDLREEFRAGVVDPWIDGYRNGATPNPCVQCNGNVRIAPMVDLADSIGAKALVTGHYARFGEEELGGVGPLLREGVDPNKDQAYALARVPKDVLARLEFPLGDMHKPEVRDIAREAGLEAADTADSQDLCFLAGVGREAFLARHGGVVENEGPVVDQAGRRVGSHRGIHNHTVGQRKGLGIGGGEPLYVLRTDSKTNTVTVAPKAAISTLRVELVDVDLRAEASRVTSARLRHHGATGDASLTVADDGTAVLSFSKPAVAVAPGQMACLLEGDLIVGCATISGAGA
jgi:tRNA-specific 2-thiouridylase